MYDTNYYGTQSLPMPPDADAPRPDLCHQCGKCCRSATTFNNHQTLLNLASQGEQEAIEFLSIFKPFPSLEAAKAIEPEQVERVLTELTSQGKGATDADVTFYYCEHVSPTGQCTIYDNRPTCCRRAPDNGWAMMPPGCGFEGWQFEQREKQKALVRSLKSQSYLLHQLSEDGVTHPSRPDTTLASLQQTIDAKILPWKRFGADLW
jgi:Fe-S-cluster containining protein